MSVFTGSVQYYIGGIVYVNRMDIPAKDLPLAEQIRTCQIECRSTYGYRRVHIWLERNGTHCNPKTVLRVMNKYNLLSVIRRKRYVKYGEALHRYPNLLNRNFIAERPNQKWLTDISYIRTGQGFLYLSVIRDLYDNSIVAYKTGSEQNINLVLNTIKAAKRAEARRIIDDYIFFYNHQRIQTKTKLTPMEFRRQYVA